MHDNLDKTRIPASFNYFAFFMPESKGADQKILHKKKLIFCTYSCVYSSLVLNQLLKSKSIDVIAIVNSTRILHPEYGALKGSLKQIRLTGWRYSTYLFFITDLFYWLRAVLRFKKNSLKTIHEIAKQHAIPLIDSKDINDQEALYFIKEAQADFLLAAHFNQLIKKPILAIDTLECINIHPSLLPLYKGVDPVFYALLAKQNTLGVSFHQMAESFDTGKIISQTNLEISGERCLYAINCKLFSLGAELAIDWISKKGQGVKQTSSKNISGDYDSWPTAKKVSLFSRGGNKLICLTDYFSNIF